MRPLPPSPPILHVSQQKMLVTIRTFTVLDLED